MVSQSTAIDSFVFKSLELYFMITNVYKEFKKTISLLKQYKSMTSIYQDDQRKLKVYRWLATVYQDFRNYEKAIVYLKKMLRLAWAIRDRQAELLAYDLLGIQFYYLGKIEDSQFYHDKMTNGALEPEDSPFYKIARQYYENNKLNARLENVSKDEAYRVYVSSGEEDADFHII